MKLAVKHTHDYNEILASFGSNTENPQDLYNEAEVHLGAEVHKVTKSCLVFVPKGVQHGPLIFNRIDRPISLFPEEPVINIFNTINFRARSALLHKPFSDWPSWYHNPCA